MRIILVALLLCAALTPRFGAAGETAPTLSRGQAFEERGGATLFASVCAACHQPDANGASGAS